jgi:DNA-binding MarR family transcriptional regulator
VARRASPREQVVALQCIRALVKALHQSARAVERGTGITNAQVFILQQLAESDGLSINELADRALTGQNTVSMVVARLTRRSLVHRGRALGDGRRVVVTLTPAGRRLLRRAPQPPTARLLAALAELPVGRVSALGRSVRALVQAMGLSEELGGMLFEQDGFSAEAAKDGYHSADARRPNHRQAERHTERAQRATRRKSR